MDFKKFGITTPKELMNYFKANMKYGFKYRNKIFTDLEPDFQQNMDKFYKLRLGEDFLKSKYGVCWDFCVLEDEFFKSAGIEHKCYFIESLLNKNDGGPTHTFALFKEKENWFWFEYSWQYYRGIHKYNSIEHALDDILTKYKSFYDNKLYAVKLYELPKFKRRVDVYEFVESCTKSKRIK